MNPKISVILNVYRRSVYFEEQLIAVKNQSIRPFEILVWENGNETVNQDLSDQLLISRANHNFGVWARFAYALNAKGDFVCVLDDDTIPGNRWFENCINTMKETPGLLGTRGLIFENKHSYSINQEIGIYNPNENSVAVDIVGHTWFFKREWLNTFWGCADKRYLSDLSGEDIHFSYALQYFLKIPTIVPKHPVNEPSLWGADPKLSLKYGSGDEGISTSKKSTMRFESALAHYRKLGFKTLIELDPLAKSKHRNLIYILIRKFPRTMHKLAEYKNKLRG
jgi:glycosyltransferase involved in cell wall biosynthesis